MSADGSVVLDVDMNVSQANKQLAKLRNNIEKTEQEISETTKKRDEAQQKSLFDAAELDAEKEKLQEIKDRLADIKAMSKNKTIDLETREGLKAQIPAVKEELAGQQTRVRMLQTEWNKTEASVERYNQKIAASTSKLDEMKDEAGNLQERINKAELAQLGMAGAVQKADAFMNALSKRIGKMASRVFVFTLITAALRNMRTWLSNTVKSNDEAAAAIAKLKGALLTLAQPIVNVIIPAFITLVNVLTKVVSAISSVVSMIFGTTAEKSAEAAESLYNQQKGLKGVGSAAKKTGKQLASFDEINKISSEDSGGGGAVSSEIAPDFSFMEKMGALDLLKQKLEGLLVPIGLIGAGFALWKISELLPASLGDIAGKVALLAIAIAGVMIFWDGLTDAFENGVDWLNLAEMIGGVALAAVVLGIAFGATAGGIAAAVGGIAIAIVSLKDAWENGLSWENVIGVLAGVTAAAVGLGLAFGPIAAGIVLVVGGIAMLVTGFKDAMESGWNLKNTLLTIAGIFATGLGIALLTGSFIPALIGAIAALLLAITVAFGEGENFIDGMKQILQGFIDFFLGVFTGDISRAIRGIEGIFSGLQKSIFAILDAVEKMFISFLDWLDEKTGGRIHGLLETVKSIIIGGIEFIKTNISTAIKGIIEFLTGLIVFINGVFKGDWDQAWSGIKDSFKAIFNTMIGFVENAMNFIIRAINFIISGLNSIRFDFPEWVPGVGGKSFGINIPPIKEAQIPRLAKGAVIPPNREFMAVLGDQRRGYNIEAPEELIRKIVREESGRNSEASTRNLTVILECDRQTLGRVIYRLNNEETQRVGVSFAM